MMHLLREATTMPVNFSVKRSKALKVVVGKRGREKGSMTSGGREWDLMWRVHDHYFSFILSSFAWRTDLLLWVQVGVGRGWKAKGDSEAGWMTDDGAHVRT